MYRREKFARVKKNLKVQCRQSMAYIPTPPRDLSRIYYFIFHTHRRYKVYVFFMRIKKFVNSFFFCNKNYFSSHRSQSLKIISMFYIYISSLMLISCIQLVRLKSLLIHQFYLSVKSHRLCVNPSHRSVKSCHVTNTKEKAASLCKISMHWWLSDQLVREHIYTAPSYVCVQ